MTRTRFTVRLDHRQTKALIEQAQARGLSRYAMLATAVETGLDQLEGRVDGNKALDEIASELAYLGERSAAVERVLDRTLFTACAAYAYARNLALGTRRSGGDIDAEALAAFERQSLLARDVLS